MPTQVIARRLQIFAAALLFPLALTACLGLNSAERHEYARRQTDAGEAAMSQRNYPAAVDALRAAWNAEATPQRALRLGTALELTQNYADAAAIYSRGIARAPHADPLLPEMTHRLAMLAAFHLDRPALLTKLLPTLPADSPYAADLRAVRALIDGEGRLALEELNAARSVPIPEELAPIIFYHAARAYFLLDDRERALQNLYEAVNRAAYAPIMSDIADFKQIVLNAPATK